MILDYEKALSIFPTFLFLVSFLIVSAVYYNRYMSDEYDDRASRSYRDYVVIMNSQSAILSVLNGLIIVVLYDNLALGIAMILITQSLTTYVFVALYMRSNYDALFFMIFTVLAYVFEFLYFLLSGTSITLFGRTMGGIAEAAFWFIVILVALSVVILGLAFYSNRHDYEENTLKKGSE